MPFENHSGRTSHLYYDFLKVDYNVKIDGIKFFDQPINIYTKTYKNIRRIATGQGGWLHNWLCIRLSLI